jgi:hypothetical protein
MLETVSVFIVPGDLLNFMVAGVSSGLRISSQLVLFWDLCAVLSVPGLFDRRSFHGYYYFAQSPQTKHS